MESVREFLTTRADLWVWFIPLLPIGGFLFHVLSGPGTSKRLTEDVACGTILFSFLVGLLAFVVVRYRGPFYSESWNWIDAAQYRLYLDPLSTVMILVVTGVAFLIHLYSAGYMAEDPGFSRYFALLNLFTGCMLLLVMSSNLLLLFVGWEGVGLCSYLLIGFWFEKTENAAAGLKAFVVNRVGDAFFLIGLLLLFTHFGTFEIQELKGIPGRTETLGWAGILLFAGAIGKSAQFPLHVWLPDAMAGPTPVSALIHAATMVTAGVYLVARVHFLYTPTGLAFVAGVGAGTALFAGTIALAQNDLKKVLAYSTISQLGFMFLGLGVGAVSAGVFHLMTHAFFKAALFLGAGVVIHAIGTQDLREMGGLWSRKRWVSVAFLVALLSIAGFMSKDSILVGALDQKGFWILGTAAAFLTAGYMGRLGIQVLFGPTRGKLQPIPSIMVGVFFVLAFLSIVGGFVPVESWLGKASPHPIAPMIVSILVLVGGLWAAYRYREAAMPEWIREGFRIDEFYARWIVAPILGCSRALGRFDNQIVDGAVNALAAEWVSTSRTVGTFDNDVVDGGVNAAAQTIQAAGRRVRRLQTGNIRTYVAGALAGGLLIVVSFCLFWLLRGKWNG